jgi:hypothetical protein
MGLNIMNRKRVVKTWVLGLIGLLVLSSALRATQVIVNDVEIKEEGKCAVIRVEFSFPVRYVKHFPYESGDDLRIQIEPIAVSQGDKEALFTRESVRPPPNDIASLLEVVYEGNIEGGPFLTLSFRRPVVFKVEQGTDFRSIIIGVHGPEALEPCSPTLED